MSIRRFVPFALSLALAAVALSSPADALTHSGFLPYNETESRLSWGGIYHRVDGLTPRGWVTIHYITLDPTRYRPAIAFSPSGLGATSPLEDMVSNEGALVGINANFFDPPSGLPIGFLLKDGRALNTPYSSRATLAIGFFGQLHFLNPRISLLLRTSHGSIPLDGINRPMYRGALIAYTPEYAGPRGFGSDVRVIAIRRDRIAWIGSNRSIRSTDRNTYWLVASGSAQARLANLLPAERVQLDYTMSPELYLIRDALQAGPMLLQGGEMALTPEGFQADVLQKPASRSAVARTHDGTLLLMIVTRGNGSAGMTLLELAEYLQALGAADAMAFDGGGSSSLVFQDGGRLRTIGSTREIPVSLVFLRR